MDVEAVRSAADAQRRELVDLLRTLTPAEWDHPSLCPGWRVRDVAAHLAFIAATPPGVLLWEMVRAGGNFDRMVRESAVRRGRQPTRAIVAAVASTVGSRRRPPGTSVYEPLIDLLVHQQDIVRPLGRVREMPLPEAAACATRVWGMGFPFRARQRLAGFHFVAADAEWSVGDGPEVRGPIAALLLTLSGRTAALSELSGPGLAPLLARTGTPHPAR